MNIDILIYIVILLNVFACVSTYIVCRLNKKYLIFYAEVLFSIIIFTYFLLTYMGVFG